MIRGPHPVLFQSMSTARTFLSTVRPRPAAASAATLLQVASFKDGKQFETGYVVKLFNATKIAEEKELFKCAALIVVVSYRCQCVDSAGSPQLRSTSCRRAFASACSPITQLTVPPSRIPTRACPADTPRWTGRQRVAHPVL